MSLSVLLTHDLFPPDFRGGGEYVVLEIALGLQARGVRVEVLTTGDPTLREHAGVATKRLPISRYTFNLQVRQIAAAARDADVIHTFTYHGCLPSLVAARLLGRPVVCGIMGLYGAAWRGMRGPVIGRAFATWERFLINRSYDRIVFPSESSRAAGLALGASVERSLVIHPGIDHAGLLPTGQKRGFVLFAGRFDTRKGIQHVIAAARALPDIPFRAVGWSDELDLLRASAPPNLLIVPSRGDSTYRQALQEASIFFFPSYAETFGLTMVEAMASGCAIVSSVSTVRFAGELVSPGDELGMIAALRRLWDDETRTKNMGRENQELAAAFTWKAHIDQLLAAYGSLLDRNLSDHVALGAANRRIRPAAGECRASTAQPNIKE